MVLWNNILWQSGTNRVLDTMEIVRHFVILVNLSCTRDLWKVLDTQYLETILDAWYLGGKGIHAAKMTELARLFRQKV